MKIVTTIRNTQHTDLDGLEPAEQALLRRLETYSEEVTVDFEATDGYYTITTDDGVTIEALSWYHLEGFDEDGTVHVG